MSFNREFGFIAKGCHAPFRLAIEILLLNIRRSNRGINQISHFGVYRNAVSDLRILLGKILAKALTGAIHTCRRSPLAVRTSRRATR